MAIKNLIIPVLFIFLLLSCNENDQKSLKKAITVRETLPETLDSGSRIYFPDNMIVISTKCPNKASPSMNTQNTSGFLRYFRTANDSIIQDSIQTISDYNRRNFHTEMTGKNYYHAGSIYFLENDYNDAIAKSELTSANNYTIRGLLAGENSVLLKSKNQPNETWFYARRNESTDSIWIAGERSNCELFLRDINNDSAPEIFFVSQFIIPSSTAGEFPMEKLEVFRISDVQTHSSD